MLIISRSQVCGTQRILSSRHCDQIKYSYNATFHNPKFVELINALLEYKLFELLSGFEQIRQGG